MAFSTGNQDVITRAATALRMVLESFGSQFAPEASEVDAFQNARWHVRDALLGFKPNTNLINAANALAALAPVQLLASAARTADTPSADQTNIVARGLVAVLNATAFAVAGSVNIIIQRKNADGTYTDIVTGVTPLTAPGAQVLVLDPVVGAGVGIFDKTVSGVLPNEWRINVDHSNTDSITYSVVAYPIR